MHKKYLDQRVAATSINLTEIITIRVYLIFLDGMETIIIDFLWKSFMPFKFLLLPYLMVKPKLTIKRK
jgi:hypothetical protein